MVMRDDPEVLPSRGWEGAGFELLPTEEVLMRGAAVPNRDAPCDCCCWDNRGAGVDWKPPKAEEEEGCAPPILPGNGAPPIPPEREGNCRLLLILLVGVPRSGGWDERKAKTNSQLEGKRKGGRKGKEGRREGRGEGKEEGKERGGGKGRRKGRRGEGGREGGRKERGGGKGRRKEGEGRGEGKEEGRRGEGGGRKERGGGRKEGEGREGSHPYYM